MNSEIFSQLLHSVHPEAQKRDYGQDVIGRLKSFVEPLAPDTFLPGVAGQEGQVPFEPILEQPRHIIFRVAPHIPLITLQQ